ncbi:unnamed protein product [Paramecium sonneborni]|uniref:Uncharacterized protein n=1 Tax=Paramecium sonneborni TaxID=65129 RepID=A0A8S1KND0_9CILI|nr:unnamed protein product [Paramecium sonneborni]
MLAQVILVAANLLWYKSMRMVIQINHNRSHKAVNFKLRRQNQNQV